VSTIEYSCGHQVAAQSHQVMPMQCACGEGEIVGARGQFYMNMSDEMSKKFREAAMNASPLQAIKEEWSGAGLPPVGMECEVVIGAQKPRTVCFVGIKSSGSVVIETVDGELKSYHRSQVIFRPIRTQAQREREEVISTAHALLIDTDTDRTVDGTLAALYDAGMLRGAGE